MYSIRDKLIELRSQEKPIDWSMYRLFKKVMLSTVAICSVITAVLVYFLRGH